KVSARQSGGEHRLDREGGKRLRGGVLRTSFYRNMDACLANVRRGANQNLPYSPNPKDTMMVDANKRFSITVVRSDLPKFASNNRLSRIRPVRGLTGEHRLFRYLLD